MKIRNKKTGEIREVSVNELNQYGLGGNMYKHGGQHGGLDRWFAEKWVDIKTGKPCGRQEGEDRNYPACRPSKRISSDTPKTSSELSSSEKERFKQEKTSSQRISYNHNRKEYGGAYMQQYKKGGNVNYIVKKGETLSKIAKDSNIPSYTTLAKLNNIKNPDYIQTGQGLYVPNRGSLPNKVTSVIPTLLRPVQQQQKQIKPFSISDLIPKTTKQQVTKQQPVKPFDISDILPKGINQKVNKQEPIKPKINTTQPINKKSIPIENNKKEIKKVDENIKTTIAPKNNNNIVNQYNITSSDANESNMYSNRSYVGKVDRVVPDRPTLNEQVQGIWDGINQRAIGSRQEEDKEAIVKKPLPKSKIKRGYKELYTVRDMKGGTKDSLLASTYTGDNDTGTVFQIGNMVANLNNRNQSFENVEGVAHFIMDGDVLPNQTHTEPYYDARGQLVSSNVPGKFINSTTGGPDDYSMYYKPTGKPNNFNVVYKQNKFGKPYLDKGWKNDLYVRSVPYSNVDWEGEGPSTGYFTKSNYIPLKNNMGATSIPYKNKSGYSRFSGGSGIYVYKDPITNREIQTNVTGSPETLKQIGESIINENNIDPNDLTFLYHDMGSYSAKPKARPDGTLNYNQWLNYNTYNRGRSGAPIMIPKQEYGGENIDNMNYLNYMKSGGNVATNPELWSRAKSVARSKYDVYPSAYSNGFAAKWYKSHGGGWRKAEYGMEVMGNGGVPTNPGFVALPEYVQQNIINNMATGGQKMPPELAYARFAAAGNLNQLGRYGYQDGGEEDVYWRTKKPMVNDPSMDAISKVLLQRNQNKNFMQRAAGFGNQNSIPTRYIDGEDPDSNGMSNLLMGFGDNYVSPTIIETFPNFLGNNSTMLRTAPGQLSYQPKQKQEYIKAPTEDIADYFAAKGYKRAANDMYGMQYQDGGDIPTIEGPSGYMNEDDVWIVDNETITKQAQELGAKKVLTEGGSLIIFDDNWNIVAADDNPDAPYKQGGSVSLNTGGENHRIYVKTTNRGEGDKGNIMVNHPTMDKGMWDTIDLTQKSGAKTISQGVAATKKWHRENPYMKEYGGDVPMYGPGGQTKPTASDSLAVMNSQIALNKFYDNEVKKRKLIKSKPERFSNFSNSKYLNDYNLDFYRTEIKNREERKKSGNPQTGKWDDSYKSNFNLNPSDVSKLEYQGLGKTKSGDSHKKYYRDLITPMQNLTSPFALVDTRIKPQHVLLYAPTDVNYPGGAVSVYDYDPIAIKPAAMKTAADWAYVKKMYGTNPPAKVNPKPPAQQTINTTQGQIIGTVRPNQIKGSELMMMINPVRSKENLERMEMIPYTFNNPKVVPNSELLPMPSKQTVDLTNLIEQRTYPIDIYDRKGNFIRKEFMGNSEGVVNPKYIGEHHYAPRGGNSYIDTNYANGGGIPERYRNMGFTNVGAKKQSTRPGKKWMVLAKKGDDYKVVHGGYKGMQDFKQHHSEQRKENFWSRMGGRNSSKATDPFSPLYWHKRFGTWEYGGQPMAVGGQNVMNPIVKKDNRNWLEYLKN